MPTPAFRLASWTLALAAALAFATAAQAAVHNVAAAEDFAKLADQVKPGDEIVVADGKHADWAVTIPFKGAAEKPVVIRPAKPGAVTFTGKTKIVLEGAEHVVFQDFVLDGCKVAEKSLILFENAGHCRVTGCRILNAIGKKNDQVIRFAHKSADNRIDNCSFVGNAARGVQIQVLAEDWQTAGYPTGNRIDHNLFQDIPDVKKPGQEGAGNGRETIQVGQGGAAEAETRTLVEHNIFLRCNGENESISNKTAANTYRFNFFKDQVGCLSLRGSSNCLVEGNRMEHAPGIHVQGKGQTVINNVLIRSGGDRKPGRQGIVGAITLSYGMEVQPPPYPQHYKAVENALVANNTIVDSPIFGLFLGSGKRQNWGKRGMRSVAPSKNRIVNNIIVGNTGELLMQDEAPDNVLDRNLVFATGAATVATYGQNPVKADPLFVDAAKGDYRLSPRSPAMKAGLVIKEIANSANIGATAEPAQYGPENPFTRADLKMEKPPAEAAKDH